jgi:hypothetical protein
MEAENKLTSSQIKEWWCEKRLLYNFGLVTSGILAFILYVVVGVNFIMPYDNDFEITLFTLFFQGFGYLMMMGLANLCYNMGVYLDLNNPENSEKFRKDLFKLGFWFSFLLPFSIPIMLLISYFSEFY